MRFFDGLSDVFCSMCLCCLFISTTDIIIIIIVIIYMSWICLTESFKIHYCVCAYLGNCQ
jgi:hypothetical protein